MEVVYWSRRRKPKVEFALGIKYVDLDELLATSDFVVVALALTPETERFFDREKFSKMKRGPSSSTWVVGGLWTPRPSWRRLRMGGSPAPPSTSST
jgi:glyoxylate reductase